MKIHLLILYLFFAILNCEDDLYYLSLDKIISGSRKYRLTLLNRKSGVSDNDLFYSGTVEYMENLIMEVFYKKKNYDSLKTEHHPLLFMFGACLFDYIKYFPDDSLFVVDPKCVNSKQDYLDYTIFYANIDEQYFIYQIESGDFYNVKLGKEIDYNMKIFFYILIGVCLLTSIFLSFIMSRVLKRMDENNILLVNFLICHISNLLFISVVGNSLSFFFFTGSESLDFFSQYLLVFFNALYKAAFYTNIILIIKGWMTTYFALELNSYKKYYKRLMLYDLFGSIFIHIIHNFINFISKLNMFYIKNELEQVVFLIFFIYCIFKKMIPLYKQMKYEENIRPDLFECLQFKYKKLFRIYLLLGIHSLWIMISPLIEKQIIYAYLYNYQLHYLFFSFYEVNFCLGLNIIFIPKRLPLYFYNDIIYNYRGLVNLVADLYEEDGQKNNNKKLNISNLKIDDLKKASNKKNYPIVLIDPFTSTKDQLLFNHIHLGNV